jgi:hypothetical protein
LENVTIANPSEYDERTACGEETCTAPGQHAMNIHDRGASRGDHWCRVPEPIRRIGIIGVVKSGAS